MSLTRRRLGAGLHEGPAHKAWPGAGNSERPEGMEQSYRKIKEKLDRQAQDVLLQLADLEIVLREEVSLTSFISGFQLGMGIAREIVHCRFEDEEGE